MTAAAPVRIGVSSCLLGERVRHDGGHKRDAYLVETLGQPVEWVPVCPEAEVGLGTPREPIRLVRDAGRHDGVRLVSRSGVRLTGRMRRFARDRLRALAKADLSGYIPKKDSPSCGRPLPSCERCIPHADHPSPRCLEQKLGRTRFSQEAQ